VVVRYARASAPWSGRVAEGLSRREHRIIEAGTGVGKSLAYLVPAAMSGQRVVIATAPKTSRTNSPPKTPHRQRHTKSKVAVLKGRTTTSVVTGPRGGWRGSDEL